MIIRYKLHIICLITCSQFGPQVSMHLVITYKLCYEHDSCNSNLVQIGLVVMSSTSEEHGNNSVTSLDHLTDHN